MNIHVIRLSQTSGSRYLALELDDETAARCPLCANIIPLACLDIDKTGKRTWGQPSGSLELPAGRRAILEYLEREEEA